MIEKDKVALKSGIWYIVSNFLLKGISFIVIPIFTRLLTQEEFGQFNNYSSWLQIMIIFVTMNLQSSLISAKYDFKDKFEEYVLTMFTISSISVLFWSIILNVFSPFFTNFFGLEIRYINFMIVYLFFYSAFLLFQLRTKFLFDYKSNILLNLINSILTPGLSVILVLIMEDKLQGKILGIVISMAIIGIYIIIKFVQKGKKINLSYYKYALKISLPYIPHSLSLVLLSSMDKIMITKIWGAEENAIYSLAINCSMLIILIVDSLNNAYAPWLGDKLNEKEYDDINKVSRNYVILFLFFALGIMLIIPEILLFLGGKDYIEAKHILGQIVLVGIYQFLYTMFVNVEQFKKKTLIMSLATVSAAFLNYVLNFIFIDKFGYTASAYIKVISYFWLLLVHMFIVYKIGYSKIYNYKFIVMISILVMLLTGIISFSYFNYILRFIFIIIYICLLLFAIYKYKFVEIIKGFSKKGRSNNV